MRLCILLRKSLLQMILQTYLNYCTHFLNITEQNYYNLRELDPLNCLACKFFTTVCSSSDLVGSISSLCVWRCGHLLVFLLSGGKVQGDSLYRLLSRTGLPLTCLVVLACHGFSIQLEGSARV